MPELRQNLATKQWVIIAPERARRPQQFLETYRPLTEEHPEHDPNCPFCPGSEDLECEIMRVPAGEEWQVRVVLNKYPALQKEGERVRSFDGVRRRISGVGHHEVVIESPRHNSCSALDTPQHLSIVLQTLQSRCCELAHDPRVEHIICFQNHGEHAGTSLLHPHSQIIALPVVPYEVRMRAEEARRYFDDTGTCVFCQMLHDELQTGERIIAENVSFVAFILYAALSPFHTWIVPRRHEASFLRASSTELADLGDILRRVLRKLYCGLRDPDYNYIIRTAPVRDPGHEYLHWYLTVVPRVTRAAGFELGSGMFINTTLPESAAAFLRSVRAG
ncbi:MAG: galactose-1-phosphate uridylyltransferase [Anaerolineae bacterium]